MELDWKALERVHDYFKRTAFSVCAKGVEVHPQLIAVQADASGTLLRMALIPPDLVARFMDSGDSKDLLRAFMVELLTEGTPLRDGLSEQMGGEPNVLVQVNEAWVTKTVHSPGGALTQTARTEAIVITLHTAEFSVIVPHDILTSPARHAVEGPFPKREQALSMGGRFAMHDSTAGRPTMH